MAVSKEKCELQQCYLCQRCLKDWMPAIASHRVNLKFKKGEVLFRQGEIIKGIHFIYRGLVKVHTHWNDDKELILRFATNGEIAGHRGLGGDPYYPVTATALEPTMVCFISLDFFNTSLTVNPGFTIHLLNFFAEELKESEKRMRNLAHMPVKGRLANALLSLKKKFGEDPAGHISIVLSRQDLAFYTGATYETVFRTLTELVNDGIIATNGKQISILNEKTLVSLSE